MMPANCFSARTVTSIPVMLSTTIRPRGSGQRGFGVDPRRGHTASLRMQHPQRLPCHG